MLFGRLWFVASSGLPKHVHIIKATGMGCVVWGRSNSYTHIGPSLSHLLCHVLTNYQIFTGQRSELQELQGAIQVARSFILGKGNGLFSSMGSCTSVISRDRTHLTWRAEAARSSHREQVLSWSNRGKSKVHSVGRERGRHTSVQSIF